MEKQEKYRALLEQVAALKKKSEHVYIYGYGTVGRNIHRILKENDIHADGFVVTKRSPGNSYKETVLEASECLSGNTGFLVAMNERNAAEVLSYLEEHGIPQEKIVNASKLVIGDRRICGIDGRGGFEIVTTIGCSMNCRYCSQKQFLSAYYRDDQGRTRMADLSLVEKSLAYFPKSYDVSFGGMSEPFLNENFMDMLELVCRSGRRVFLYTTLVGLKKEWIPRLLKMPFSDVVVHVADAKGYANIPLTEEYFEVLEELVHGKKPDGTPFIRMCNAQTIPNKKVEEIVHSGGWKSSTR